MIKFFEMPYMFLIFILIGGFISFLVFHILSMILYGFIAGAVTFVVLDMLTRWFINS